MTASKKQQDWEMKPEARRGNETGFFDAGHIT
jgi:hypothetical protein